MKSQQVTLSSVAKIIMGTSPKGDTYNITGNGLPLINGPTEFGDDHPDCTLFTTKSSKECTNGDLIFCVRGSTTGRMNWADKKYSLGKVNIFIPDELLMNKFLEIAEPIYSQIKNLQFYNQKLSQVRDMILPRLMSGVIEV